MISWVAVLGNSSTRVLGFTCKSCWFSGSEMCTGMGIFVLGFRVFHSMVLFCQVFDVLQSMYSTEI